LFTSALLKNLGIFSFFADHLRSTHAFGGEHVYRKDTSRRGDFPIQSFDFVSAVYNPFNLRRHLISHPIATLAGSPSRIGSRFATGNSLKRANCSRSYFSVGVSLVQLLVSDWADRGNRG